MTGCCLRVSLHHDDDDADGAGADGDADGVYDDDDTNDKVFAGRCNVQARSTVLRRSNRLNFGQLLHFSTSFIRHSPKKGFQTKLLLSSKLNFHLQVQCSGCFHLNF